MSIMIWKVLRRLPKPLLLVLLFFVLAAVGARLARIVSKGWPAAAGLAALIPDLRCCPASSWPAASPVKR